MINQSSPIHGSFGAKDCRRFELGVDYSMDEIETLLPMIGVQIDKTALRNMMSSSFMGSAMDTIQQPVTTPSIGAPLQFLQNFLPGIVHAVTAARKIDDLIGATTAGAWEDEQVIQQVLEVTGGPQAYGDLNNIPLASWNNNFVARTVVRFEQGLKVGPLELARSARINIDSAAAKRGSAAMQLEINRNQIGFYGYNEGANLTYGFLNDPNLPSYVTVATGPVSASTLWSNKTFLEIQADILTALQTLRTQSQDTIDPGNTPIVLAVATNCRDYLAKTSDFGISVMDWLKSTYPNVRVESAPQLNGANGGANVFYLYAETVEDGVSTDDRRTFIQVVPSRFFLLGVQQLAKGYEEDYSNATAGVMVKRPYAVVRRSGI